MERVERAAEAAYAASGRRVAITRGHSRGGHFARALAATRPDLVSHAISMGADLQGLFGFPQSFAPLGAADRDRLGNCCASCSPAARDLLLGYTRDPA